MKVLLNGCSFMDNWHYGNYLKNTLSADVINLAKAGSSNRRIIRTTVDYLEETQVDIVILGLTFYDRQESPFKIHNTDPWVSYNAQGMQAVFSAVEDFESLTAHKLIGDYILDRYRYDINHHYLDSLYLDLRLLTSYLLKRKIKFAIVNMCDKHHKNIDLGAGVVPLTFIGNVYLEENGVSCEEQDKQLQQNARHHYNKDATILIDYLIEFINASKF